MKKISVIANMVVATALLASPLAQANTTTLNIKHTPKLTYPNSARQAKQQGVVVVIGQVNAQGKVASAHIKQSSGFTSLDQAALKHIQQFRFQRLPDGQKTAAFEQAVQFQLQ